MRKKINIILLSAVLLLLNVSCTIDTDDRHYHIRFKNNANYIIRVTYDESYPDTASLSKYLNFNLNFSDCAVFPDSNSGDAIWSWTFFEKEFSKTVFANGDTVGYDTLMVFVFNEDTLNRYGLEYARKNYLVQQRYDLSLDDVKRLNWQLFFPPTEAMRDIKMWPPYGTYDAHGNRVE